MDNQCFLIILNINSLNFCDKDGSTFVIAVLCALYKEMHPRHAPWSDVTHFYLSRFKEVEAQ